MGSPKNIRADNVEPTTVNQSILASAISSGMPTFLLTKGVSNGFLKVPLSDSRDGRTVTNAFVSYVCMRHTTMYIAALQTKLVVEPHRPHICVGQYVKAALPYKCAAQPVQQSGISLGRVVLRTRAIIVTEARTGGTESVLL